MTNLGLRKTYGNIIGFFWGDEPCLLVCDLDLLENIYLKHSRSYRERGAMLVENPLSVSVLFAKYHRWLKARKLLRASFGGLKVRGSSSSEFIEQSVLLMMDYIEEKFRIAKARRISIDMHDLMKATTLHIISNMCIPLEDIQVRESDPYVKSLDNFLANFDGSFANLLITFPLIKPVVEFLVNFIEFDKMLALIQRNLNEKIAKELKRLSTATSGADREPQKAPQLIDNLIKAHHEHKMTHLEVVGNAEATLFAGYDTTSTALIYCFWVLGKYPQVQERLRDELKVHGTEAEYLEQVISETLRLYPSVVTFAMRMATETLTIGKWTIPQGTRIIFDCWQMHRDPAHWTEPDKFDPSRFQAGAKIHPCAYAPFGLGAHKCLGFNLAKLEMKAIICDILLRYRIILRAPKSLELVTYANTFSKPREKIEVDLERL